MKRYLLAGILLAAVGCKQNDGKVSNVATNYTTALQEDVQKAQAAADKANKAVAADNSAMGQAQDQTK